MIISALCIFAEDYEGDKANAAAEALRAAGYQVFRLSPEQKARLEIEGDDFIEARRRGGDDFASDAMRDDVIRVVGPFGGDVDDVGGPASVEPFAGLFRV
jgi:hypothetical protein